MDHHLHMIFVALQATILDCILKVFHLNTFSLNYVQNWLN